MHTSHLIYIMYLCVLYPWMCAQAGIQLRWSVDRVESFTTHWEHQSKPFIICGQQTFSLWVMRQCALSVPWYPVKILSRLCWCALGNMERLIVLSCNAVRVLPLYLITSILCVRSWCVDDAWVNWARCDVFSVDFRALCLVLFLLPVWFAWSLKLFSRLSNCFAFRR